MAHTMFKLKLGWDLVFFFIAGLYVEYTQMGSFSPYVRLTNHQSEILHSLIFENINLPVF